MRRSVPPPDTAFDLPVADDAGEFAFFFTFSRVGDETLSAELPLPRQPVAALAEAI